MTANRLAVAHAALVTLGVLSLSGCLAHERAADDAGGDRQDAEARDAFVRPDAGGGCEACDAETFPDAGRDGGLDLDVGWCECPAPPPGCTYDGTPCVCSHLTCAPERCGREVCGAGTFCCNASCGICVGPGEGCIDLACAPDCSPQDARSSGRCAGSPGWAWDGTDCRALACSCEGTDCDAIFVTQTECNAVFGACLPADARP